MPAYSFYFFQFLNIRCFRSFKKAYNRQIETFMRLYIIYINKKDFLFAFKKAFNIFMILLNI